MPEKETLKRARADKRKGRSPSTQAGEFVREEIHHVREGKHGARSAKQAIAIGLSKARRAGVKLPAPEKGPKSVRRQALRELARAKHGPRKPKARSLAAKKAVRTKGPAGRHAAAVKAARTWAREKARHH